MTSTLFSVLKTSTHMGYYNHNYISFLSNVDHEFSNLFRKICPLIYQNLITCWKCSRGFFAFLLYQKHAGYEVANKLVLPTFFTIAVSFSSNFSFHKSSVNLLHILRTPFLKNTSGRLLLNFAFETSFAFETKLRPWLEKLEIR